MKHTPATRDVLARLRTSPLDWHSSAEIAAACDLSESTARRALQKLELGGKVTCRRSGITSGTGPLLWRART
jgi:predicted transcriptional regulator